MTPRFRSAVLLLAFLALALGGCRAGYETETLRGQGVREWFIPMDGGRVEVLAIWPARVEEQVPALLLVHGDKDSGQVFRRTMFNLARRNIYVMSVSLPGYGDSTGPEDFGGPRSVKAIQLAVDYLASQSEVRLGGLAIYGEGIGAAPALAAAAQDARIRAAVAEEPIADLAAAFPKLTDALRGRLLRAAGGPPAERPEAYRQRSAREWADKLRIPLLVIHNRNSRLTTLEQARALVQAVQRHGAKTEFQTTGAQTLGLDPRRPSLQQWVIPFIRRHLPPEQPLQRGP